MAKKSNELFKRVMQKRIERSKRMKNRKSRINKS